MKDYLCDNGHILTFGRILNTNENIQQETCAMCSRFVGIDEATNEFFNCLQCKFFYCCKDCYYRRKTFLDETNNNSIVTSYANEVSIKWQKKLFTAIALNSVVFF